MTQESAMHTPVFPAAVPQRKPRLALMGEFSAGKSTLTNLLVGRQPLPTRVTATRLPPVWISHGPEAASITATDGSKTPLRPEDLANVPMDTTALIRLTLPAEALELCDLIDMPGISDPNMPSSVWQNLLPEVDGVIWCTHATQAWRQSEAAVWEEISHRFEGPSTLLITHFDKLRNSRDQDRVVRRVRKETGVAFGAIFPLSLSQALAAGEDMEVWKTSGADSFIEYLVDMLVTWAQPNRVAPAQSNPAASAQNPQTEQPLGADVLDFGGRRESGEQPQLQESPACADADGRVTPRRVTPVKRSKRPARSRPETHPTGE
ncbi:dynamin family protein [Leisingera sp. M658]|uniref:dynamin family protein n=1 Tax=Leisingera sp. M658 TaxID=2867015 RepID=UPI0021A73A09|nr:dynamin family protein [Leisingera sp. M658]UWQ74276.1 dynamin family protein [Leisingera sp. M658]